MSERTFEVQFAVEEHPDTEREVVTVEAGIIGGASPRERAVMKAAGNSPSTHVETLAIREIEDESDAPTTAESEAHRTKIEPSGRYDELAIDGVPAQSVAIDYGKEPPELIVHNAGARCVKSFDPNMPSYVIELPTKKTPNGEN